MIELKLMSEEDFQIIKGKMIADYSKSKVTIGVWAEEEALELAKETFNTLLKNGLATKKHYFYNIYKNDEKIGYTWNAIPDREMFIYNVEVFEKYKDMEYEDEIMKKIEENAKKLGANRITVHLFGNSIELLKMYQKMGYQLTDITICKKV
ncbi:MAG: hypothetical protein PWP46_55 [Fusobacteriaceae bacterium]|jgi:ribosomal protein S18 acetylase RimI-like enzyme|nr:hypothetical protein [Fusobacteriaceae bacterium]